MAERVMLGLGEFRFEIATAAYQKFSLNQSWRWPEQARINRDPALQFVGRNVGEIELEGVIYPSFKGGLSQIEAMRTLADTGKPQQLVDGLGRVWGAWVMTEISDTRTLLADDGQPRKVEFRVKLKAYGEDEGGKGWVSPVVSGMPAVASSSDFSEAASLLDALSAEAEALPALTEAIPPEALQGPRNLIREVAQSMAGVAHAVSGTIGETLGAVRQGVKEAIPTSALQAIEDLKTTAGDIVSLKQRLPLLASEGAALPKRLKRDLACLDGQLRLATYSAASVGQRLRETEQTFATVACLSSTAESQLREAVARTAGTLANQAEQFVQLCTKAQGCTGKVLEKWHA